MNQRRARGLCFTTIHQAIRAGTGDAGWSDRNKGTRNTYVGFRVIARSA